VSFLFARDQGADRVACPDLIQFSQQEGGVLRVIEAGVVGRVAGKQDADRVAASAMPTRTLTPVMIGPHSPAHATRSVVASDRQ
jgi:hypothetical protein